MEIQTRNQDSLQNGQISIILNAVARGYCTPIHPLSKVSVGQLETDKNYDFRSFRIRSLLRAFNNVPEIQQKINRSNFIQFYFEKDSIDKVQGWPVDLCRFERFECDKIRKG